VTNAAETTGPSSDTTQGLTVLVADEDAEALRSTARVLGHLGHHVAAYAVSVGQAAQQIS
jgi:AmiR/NasT family two-component response regulator